MAEDAPVLDVRYLSDTFADLPGGGRLYYEDRGEGTPILTINNFNTWAPMWRTFLGGLVDDHRIISYDLRDQGASSTGGQPAGLPEHVDDIVALLDHLGIERAFVLSSSISTLIGRDLSLKHPDRVAGHVFVGPAFSPNGGLRRKLYIRTLLASLEHSSAALVEHLYALVFSDQTIHAGGTAAFVGLREGQLQAMDRDAVRAALTATIADEDNPADLARLGAPVQFMIGDGDFLWSPSVLEDALALVPNSQSVIIPRAGHIPFFDQPALFQSAVREFIASTVAATAVSVP